MAGAQDRALAVGIRAGAIGLAELFDLRAELLEALGLGPGRLGDRDRSSSRLRQGSSKVGILHRPGQDAPNLVAAGDIMHDDRVGSDLRARADPHRSDDLRAGPDLRAALERGPVEVAGAQPDRDNGASTAPAPIRTSPSTTT
jgi:hypothetical protein